MVCLTGEQNMIKYTKHNLNRLEDIFQELKITIRYEKGNFQSGYCIVSGKNIVIVNKFFDIEARMNTLLEILEDGGIDLTGMSEESHDWYSKLRKSLAKTA
jgi:hypothetical protein